MAEETRGLESLQDLDKGVCLAASEPERDFGH